MTIRMFIGVVVVGTAGLAGLWQWGHRSVTPHTPTTTNVECDRQNQLETQLSDLTEEVRQLRINQAERATLPVAPPSASAMPKAEGATREAPIVDPTEPDPGAAQAERQNEALERIVDKETPDPKWAATARQAVLNAYSGSDFENVKFNANCRATLCRVDVDMSNSPKPEIAARMLAFHQPWPAQTFMKVDTSTQRVELFLARENHELHVED